MSGVIRKGGKAFRDTIRKFNREGARVKVGIFASGKPRSDDSALTNAEIGAVHEFGAPDAGVPARPWLKPAIQKHAEEYNRALEGVVKTAMEGGSVLPGLGRIGAKAAADVKAYIVAGEPPQNLAPSTLARKQAKTAKGSTGTPKALIDTSQMLNAITFKVEKGAKDK